MHARALLRVLHCTALTSQRSALHAHSVYTAYPYLALHITLHNSYFLLHNSYFLLHTLQAYTSLNSTTHVSQCEGTACTHTTALHSSHFPMHSMHAQCCTAQLTPPIVHYTHHIAQLAHLPPVSAHCSMQTPSSVCTAYCKHACTSHHVNCSHRKATHCSPCSFVTAFMPPMCCTHCTLPPAWHPAHLHSIPAHLLCGCTGFALVRDRLQRRAAYPRCATLCKGSPGWAAASSMQAASAPPLQAPSQTEFPQGKQTTVHPFIHL